MRFPWLVLALSFCTFGWSALAQTVPDRKAAVLKDRATMESDARWIYNDYERGFEEAKRTGKPVLVVLRCIPCLACAGIDAKVVLESGELSPLLDKFVCVRVINANTLDLSRFQFDFDLSFTTMIFNADGTVYGRYGSWTHQKNPREETTEGFRKTLEAALDLHRNYPANKADLAGKQGAVTPYKSPLELPTIQGKYTRNLDWEGKVVASCVHCHQIGDALRTSYRTRKETIPSKLIYPFPSAETVGVELAVDGLAHVKGVATSSAAERAGIQAGDEIVRLAGQPLLSIADFSWALHQAPDSGEIPVEVRRGDQRSTLTLALNDGWRNHSDISRRVGTWGMRAMALGGLQLEDLSKEERARRGLELDRLALLAKHVGEYGEHAAAKKAGFKKGDILVEVAGATTRETEGELIGRLLKNYPAGSSVKATVLRGEERVELNLPMQ